MCACKIGVYDDGMMQVTVAPVALDAAKVVEEHNPDGSPPDVYGLDCWG